MGPSLFDCEKAIFCAPEVRQRFIGFGGQAVSGKGLLKKQPVTGRRAIQRDGLAPKILDRADVRRNDEVKNRPRYRHEDEKIFAIFRGLYKVVSGLMRNMISACGEAVDLLDGVSRNHNLDLQSLALKITLFFRDKERPVVRRLTDHRDPQ